MSNHDIDRARDALSAIPPNLVRDDWVKVGMASQAAGLRFEDFDDWSQPAPNYDSRASRDTWQSFTQVEGGITSATLFSIAIKHGWSDPVKKAPLTKSAPLLSPPRTPLMTADEVWKRCLPIHTHSYATKKGATAEALAGLRSVPDGDPLRIMNEPMDGSLVVPCFDVDGRLSTLQFITSGDVEARLKAVKKPTKLNLPGSKVDGFFTVGELKPGELTYLVEGIGQAWSAWQSTGAASVVCFGAGNIGKVAKALRQMDGNARLVICPDRGREADALKVAAEIGCAVACLHESEPDNFDVNDLFQRDGFDVVATLLESASEPPVQYALSVAFADELSEHFEAPDELVENILTTGDGSMLFGDTNCGKTFIAIDIAASIARGVDWMGHRIEQGLVVYIAAESPSSVRCRLQAYQKFHNCKVPNFAIVQSRIDLFENDIDTDHIIKLVKQLERQRKQKVRLIVGDTLARLSAGANENAGQDMGLVVRRFDQIRTECKAHFLLIHHSGKATAAGARGWSGVRAAIDTEIEIGDSPAGRFIEIKKQRDLGSKGTRIGFKLEVVSLGFTKWGTSATSCIVQAAVAPDKPITKRMGEVEGAVVEFLAAHKVGIKKIEVVKHFVGRYEKGPVYRAIKALVTACALHEAAGMVCVATVAK